jgi:glycerol-3-phosphate acyltransferase PlsY
MDLWIALLAVISSYLVGSFSFARLFTRILAPEVDIENLKLPSDTNEEGTPLLRISATTASTELGGRWGCLIGILDILKVALPVLVFRLIYPDHYYFLLAAVFGMVGHNWPIYYRFKGGSGVSSIYGGWLVIDPIGAFVCSTAGMILGFFVIKDILVAYLSGAWLMIPWFWFRTRDPAYLAYTIAVNIIFVLALIPEIKMMIKAHREGTYEMTNSMEKFPMGRGMLRIMEKFGAVKKS